MTTFHASDVTPQSRRALGAMIASRGSETLQDMLQKIETALWAGQDVTITTTEPPVSTSDIAAEIDQRIMQAFDLAIRVGGVQEAAGYVLERVNTLAAECALPTTR